MGTFYYYLRLRYAGRRWMTRTFTPMGLGVLLWALIAAGLGLGTQDSLCHLLFVFAVVLLGIAAITRQLIAYQFKATRTLPRFVTVGESLHYPVVLKNVTRSPQLDLWLSDQFVQPYPSLRAFLKFRAGAGPGWLHRWWQAVAERQGAIASPTSVPVLAAHKKTKVLAQLCPVRRGRLEFNEIMLTGTDPLGLLYHHRAYCLPQSVCVLPQRYQFPPLKFPGLRQHQLGDVTLTQTVGEALEFRSLRDYRPGDPMNKIHWKSWAKVARPIVKEQQDESALRYGLIVDTFPLDVANYFPDMLRHNGQAYERAALEAVIAIAISFLFQDETPETHLDILYATDAPHCQTVGRGLRQRSPILETLATLPPHPQLALEHMTPMVQERLPRWSACICLLTGIDPARSELLEQLRQRGMPTTVFYLYEPYAYAGQPPINPEHWPWGHQCRLYALGLHTIQQDLMTYAPFN